jgi:hypothetical protein
MNLKNSIVVLHKYFIWADRMRFHLDQLIKTDIRRTKPKSNEEANIYQIEFNIYMSYWYGGMYVLIEGWKELKLSDPKIDKLLKSSNVNLLKRYRNGAFHFQKNYWDDRFMGFISSSDSVPWVRELREEFSRFFLDNLSNKDVA